MLSNAKKRYEELMLELACRKNNEHVGSGMGGNPTQLLTMLALSPTFSNTSNEELFTVDNETLLISVEKMSSVSKKEIRKALDKTLTLELTNKYANPELVKFLSGEKYSGELDSLCIGKEQKNLFQAGFLASKIKDLVQLELKENSDPVPIESLSPELQKAYADLRSLDKWLILAGCRTFLGIELIVKYNLDEIFFDMFNQINVAVDTD